MSQAGFAFYSTESRRSTDLVRRTFEICESVDGFEIGPPDETVEPDDFSLKKGGGFELYWQNGPGRVSVGFKDESFPEHFISIFIQRHIFFPEDDEGEYEGLTSAVMELVRALAIEHNPYYVVSPNPEPEVGPDPVDVMPTTAEFELGRIPWFGVYSSSLIDELGGREHVLETPAWHVEELETGSILLIRTRAPWAYLGRDHPVDRYLLDGEDDATDDSGDVDSLGLQDPFAALSAGDYGADVCVTPEDIDPEFPNEDLQLERVYVDESGDLRRVDDDTFVRNVVDGHYEDDGAFLEAMLSEVPDDADHDRLMVSTLLHERIPTTFVRLEDPDDENVVTRVLDLGVDIDKHDLLFSLARVANEGDFEDDEVASIEGALETLADVDDPEVAERIIEERLLL
ncbi:hypothetical protein [Halomicrobium salinisoli]|uniref:hypothetical protein n=1 Tax=Halomicrobium salinisoli TaxID=2878391 RepID=UPI001CF0880E|nr:hypothetical protein [Halomicrobium salinisoli]